MRRPLVIWMCTRPCYVMDFAAGLGRGLPVYGQMTPEQLKIDRLHREVTKPKAERDILDKAAAYCAKDSK